MSKCRGCGSDTSSGHSSDVPGLGWMHDLCEIKRLNGLYEEAQGFNEQLENVTQVGWFNPASKRFCYLDEKKNRPDKFAGYTLQVYIRRNDVQE